MTDWVFAGDAAGLAAEDARRLVDSEIPSQRAGEMAAAA